MGAGLQRIGGSLSNGAGSGPDFNHGLNTQPTSLQIREESKRSDDRLFEELLDTLEDGTFGSIEYDARRVVDHLRNGNGADFYWGSEVTNTANRIPAGREIQASIHQQFISQMSLYQGDVSKLNIIVNKPNFTAYQSLDLKTLISGTQQVDIWLEDIQYNGNSYTAQVVYRIMDDFGVCENDVLNPSRAAWFGREGLKSFWILQHQRGYKPFRTSLSIKTTIYGKI